MKNILRSIAILLLSFFFSSCGKEAKPMEKVLRPVLYQEVAYGNMGNSRTFNGTAETDQIIGLSFRSSGIITLFNMTIGQRVKKGQLLARLDNVQARLAYEQALASLNSAESQEKTAKLSLNRVRTLYEKGSSSLSDYENVKNSYQNALNSLEASKRSVDIQKEQIKYGFIYAPQSGVIASVNAELGENAGAGNPVAVLNAGGKITINLGIPESVINSLSPNMKVSIEFPALQGQKFTGQVREISPTIDRSTTTYPVKVEIMDVNESVKSGMAANVTFSFNKKKEASLVIPAKSVGEDSKGRFVFLVNETKPGIAEVKKQHVQIGDLDSQGFVVLEGLTEGQKIAVAGLQSLIDGQEVKLPK